MAEFRRAGTTRINAFEVEGTYLFKHYFEEEAVFSALRRYYSRYEYRFEVPAARLGRVRSILEEHGYALIDVAEVEPFAVVKRKYTAHPRVLFEDSVVQRGLGQFNCFVMKDEAAVDRAIEAGARRLSETDLDLQL